MIEPAAGARYDLRVLGLAPSTWHQLQKFGGRTYTYLEVDGYKYWAISPVINRARLSR